MTTKQNSLGAARDSRSAGVPEADEPFSLKKPEDTADRGNVVELYPGAGSRYTGAIGRYPRASSGRIRVMGTEAGMATAEYTNVDST